VTQDEARRQAKGFIRILEIKIQQDPSEPITKILEEMLFEQFLMRGKARKKV